MLVFFLFILIGSSYGFPKEKPSPQPQDEPISARQLLYVPTGQQQFLPNYPYDFSILEPSPPFQLSGYGFGGEKQIFPRIQPQLLIYSGGSVPNGQPFLLQPGGAPPPGNFLVPQPGPNVILRDSPNQRPVFAAGYPKPAHIPPIEKDAEEVPTNPARIPPITARKPEKLETFNEPETPRKTPTEAEVLAERNPSIFSKHGLRPGQRFFILNGQPLFSNYPLQDYSESGPNTAQLTEQDKQVPIQNVLLRNSAPNENNAGRDGNLVLLDQSANYQDTIFRNILPFSLVQKDNQFFQYQALNGDAENDAIIIDARESDQLNNAPQTDSEVVSAAEKDTAEPTISQAQPSAVALAGPGGIADASPRGNAFVGVGGVAVSSPQATAVAGPSKDGESEQKTRKQINKNKKQ